MAKSLKKLEDLRSHRWYGVKDLRAFGHHSRTLQMGYDREDYEGKPVIAILNNWSDMMPCHFHFKQRVEEIKRGVFQAGGFPIEIPTMVLSEPMQKPTTMLYRNLLAMEVEELLRSYPCDGVVLMGGCDKTTPAMIMGATTMNIPSLFMPAGPMLNGNWHGKEIGSGSDTWKYWAELRAGNITEREWQEVEEGIARSHGHCMTMGTASTMTSIAETLGLSLPGSASIPASDSMHGRMAVACGRRIVDMVWEDLTPKDIITLKAVENAIAVAAALGGSTNSLVHIIAMAGRAGHKITLERFDEIAAAVPTLANCRPSGKYLMEDFYYAGGLPALQVRLKEILNLEEINGNGKNLGENIAGVKVYNDDVIRPLDNPVYPAGGLAVLRGNLCPDGAVIKPTAADPKFRKHTGPALVFNDYNELAAKIDDPDLDVTENTVLVLRNSGPLGGPGMPEWGMLPIPQKLLKQGIRDMVRISDARMSGTSYGTCILHVSPESFIGGALALVKTGDMIELDVAARKLNLIIDDSELAARKAAWTQPKPHYPRGYGQMFSKHVTQAHLGCDFDFLEETTEPVPEPEIH